MIQAAKIIGTGLATTGIGLLFGAVSSGIGYVEVLPGAALDCPNILGDTVLLGEIFASTHCYLSYVDYTVVLFHVC